MDDHIEKSIVDKPDSMSVKEHIYRRISREQQIPFSIVRTVIDNQFQTALTALMDENINSLEIAGLGKVRLNERRLWVEIRKMRYFMEYYPKFLLIPDLTQREIEKAKGEHRDAVIELEVYLKRAEVLKIEVPIDENLSQKVDADIRKKIKERNELKEN